MRSAALLAVLAVAAAAQDPAAPGLVALEARAGGAPVVDTAVSDLDADGRSDVLFLIGGPDPAFAVAFQDGSGGGFLPPRRVPIPPGTAAFGIADLLPAAGKDLYFLAASGVSARTLAADGEVRAFAALDLVFPPDRSGPPAWWEHGRDVDGDGRDDLVLPGLDGAWFLRGGPDGKPAGPPAAILVPAEVRAQRDPAGLLAWRFRSPRVAFRTLLERGAAVPVWQDGEGLRRLGRQPDGSFGGPPVLHFAFGGGGGGGLGILQRSSIRMEDLDGDGLDDLVVARSRAEGMVIPELRSELLFFLNRGRPATAPSHVLVLPGNLSSGPDLVDADGDGVLDLWLSVEGAGMKSGVQRLLGKIKLTWYLYRGTAKEPPFGRTPDLTFEDMVPGDVYDAWGLRHRLFLSRDWDGDGRSDLARLSGDAGSGTKLDVHPAPARPEPYRPADAPTATITMRAPVRAHRAATLAPGRPAIQLDLPDGVVFLAPAPR